MTSPNTTAPALPAVPTTSDPGVANYLQAINLAIQALYGNSNSLSSLVSTVQTNVAAVSGTANSAAATAASAVSGVTAINTASAKDLTPPPAPTTVGITAGLTDIFITTDKPSFTMGHGYDHTNVYAVQVTSQADTTKTFANATLVHQFVGQVGSFVSDPSVQWRVWVTWVTVDGVEGPTTPNNTQGTYIQAGVDVSNLLTALNGQLTSSQLDAALTSSINQIAVNSGNISTTSGAVSTLQSQMTTVSGSVNTNASNITTLTSTVNTNNSNQTAALNSEATTRANADSSLSSQITTLTSTVNNNYSSLNSAIQSEATTRASADTTNANAITTLQSTTYPNNNLLSNPTAALGLTDWTAVSGTLNTVLGGAGEGYYFQNGNATSANGGLNYTQDIAYVAAAGPISIQAMIFAAGITMTSGTYAQARVYVEWLDTNKAHLGYTATCAVQAGTGWTLVEQPNQSPPANTVYARVHIDIYGDGAWTNTNAAWRNIKVEPGSVCTNYNDSVTAGALNAAVQTEASTRATQTGELQAQYTVKVDVNGYIAGYGLASTANNSTPTSSFAVRADEFYIANPTGPTIAPAMPFVVVTTPQTINGQTVPVGVYMNAAFIQNGTITSAQIGQASIDDANIANLNVSKLQAGALTTGAYIQSSSYTAGSAGWIIKADGSAELNNVTVRGGGTFSGALSAATGTFAGSLSAATGTFSGQVDGGSIATGAYAGGSYAWPAAHAGGGSYMDSNGLLLGNYNSWLNGYGGGYFQVDASGNVYAPNFSIVNGTMTLPSAVVGTAQIQNGAVTTAQIGSLQVTTANIANLSVDGTKITGIVSGSVVANAAQVTINTVSGRYPLAQIISVNGQANETSGTGTYLEIYSGYFIIVSPVSLQNTIVYAYI